MRINFVFRFLLIISIFEILFFSTSCQNFLKPNPDIQEERLRNAIAEELEKGDDHPQFSLIFRMCRQAIKEFDNIMSK